MYPTLAAVKKLSAQYNRIPIYRELNISQIGFLALVKALEDESGIIFLESAKENKKWSRFSFLGISPRKIIACTQSGLTEKSSLGEKTIPDDLFSYLKKEMNMYRSPLYPRFGSFNGGFTGYFGFDLVNHSGILRKPVKEENGTPAALLAQIDDFIVYDNVKEGFNIATCLYPDPDTPLRDQYNTVQLYLEQMEERILTLVEKTPIPYLPSRPEEASIDFHESRESFMVRVNKIKDLIGSGEAIQAVLSMRAGIDVRADPYRFYLKLRSLNPSPYMFYCKIGDLVIAGSSPEIHVKVEGRRAFLKPIAGTAPRGSTRTENLGRRQALLEDSKERAEHLMLVDLARNDLGRIASPGSVKVERFMIPEDYSHVIHLVSLVSCNLAPSKDAVDALRETFPAGTVSGAPKVRAMEIIDETETQARGIYAGAVGYIGYNGVMDTCITIRTAVFSPRERYIQAGAGIVYDSVPGKEYEEIQNKLKALSISLQYAIKKEAHTCS